MSQITLAGRARPARASRTRAEWRAVGVTAAFVAPALAIYLTFAIYPVVQSINYSFYQWAGPGRVAEFVGLGNYAAMFKDPVFWQSLWHTGFVLLFTLLAQVPIGLVLAVLITGPLRARRLWRGFFFIPTLVSTVAIGILWSFIFHPSFGAVNGVLRAVGLDAWAQGWLGQGSTALWAVMVAITWQWAPFHMIIYIAAISSIPGELYEAGTLDGASRRQMFWRITMPILKPTILMDSILALVGSIKAFDMVYVMTKGGPNSATELLATYVYRQGFKNYSFGYASTLAVAMLVLALVLTCAVLSRSWLAARRERLGK